MTSPEAISFRWPLAGIERPEMEADVAIVGVGPAGLACALRLAQLIDEHNAKSPTGQIGEAWRIPPCNK